MSNMDFETCYTALELPFGAGLKEINERWRKLSRIHHPDRHARNPKNYQIALEKQKQLNNARDILKKWFETNPHATPPRSASTSQQSQAQNKSANANRSTSNNSAKSQSSTSNSQTKQAAQNQERRTQSQSDQQKAGSRTGTTSSSQRTQTKRPPDTGWFATSELKLTPLQELVWKIDNHCSGEPSFLAMILLFAALFGPLIVISGTLGAIFPELPGHYPDWLLMIMFVASGWCTRYLFRWFFSEVELIKLQQQEMYFRSTHTVGDTVDLAKNIIGRHVAPNVTWTFAPTGTAHEATLHFEEEVFPDVKRPRCLKIRFEARPGAYSVVFGVQFKATSPINSFSCKTIAEKVVTDLKKELQQIAA